MKALRLLTVLVVLSALCTCYTMTMLWSLVAAVCTTPFEFHAPAHTPRHSMSSQYMYASLSLIGLCALVRWCVVTSTPITSHFYCRLAPVWALAAASPW